MERSVPPQKVFEKLKEIALEATDREADNVVYFLHYLKYFSSMMWQGGKLNEDTIFCLVFDAECVFEIIPLLTLIALFLAQNNVIPVDYLIVPKMRNLKVYLDNHRGCGNLQIINAMYNQEFRQLLLPLKLYPFDQMTLFMKLAALIAGGAEGYKVPFVEVCKNLFHDAPLFKVAKIIRDLSEQDVKHEFEKISFEKEKKSRLEREKDRGCSIQ